MLKKDLMLQKNKKEFDCKLICNRKFLEIKIKSYGDGTKYFYDKKMYKVDSNYIFWSITLTDSALKKDENYYPQVFLKECKDIEKEKKW